MRTFPARMLPFAAPLLVALLAFPTQAKEPDALELMHKSDKRHRIREERMKLEMILQAKGGPKRQRLAEMYVFQDPEEKGDKMWLRFLAPGDVKGTTLLGHEKKNADDDQWLYLPAFKKSRRVGTSELGDRFAGTDFCFEDLKRRVVDDYSYKLKGSDACGDAQCWLIEASPKAAHVVKSSPYSRSEVWMRKDNLFIVKVQHFDKKGKALRQLIFGGIEPIKGTDAWRATSLEAVDVQRKHRTVMRTVGREVNQGIPDTIFNSSTFQR